MLWWRRFDLKCIVWKMDLQESGGKNCQVVGADHNLKLDPNGLFKVAAPVWIFRDLCTALERGQRQRRQRECISARRFGRTPARTQRSNQCEKCNQRRHRFTFSMIQGDGIRAWLCCTGSFPLMEVRRKWDTFLDVCSPRGRVIILIYLLPAMQLLCSAGSDHLWGFIISAGAR